MEIKFTPLLKFVLIISSSFIFSNCGSTKGIKQLSSQINCSKKIYFIWDDKSNYFKTEKTGNFNYLVKGKKRNHKEIFINSINKINKKYKGDYLYSEHPGFPSDSVILVSVKLEKIVWNMGFSKIIVDMQLTYTTNGNHLGLIGQSIGFKGEKSYMQCFEDATLQFIIANCNN